MSSTINVTATFCLLLSFLNLFVDGLLLAKSGTVCADSEYHIGCSDETGTKVLNISSVSIALGMEDGAISCDGGFGCSVTIGKDGDNLVNAAMLELYKKIMENCHGKRQCKGRAPDYQSITWDPSDETDRCGLFGEVEYLSDINIDGICLDPKDVQPFTIPDVTVLSTDVLQNVETTTETTPTTMTPEVTTNPEPVSAETSTTTKSTSTTDSDKTDLEGKSYQLINNNTNLSDLAVGLIIVGIIVGLAVLVAVVMVLYLMIMKATVVSNKVVGTDMTETKVNTSSEELADNTA